MRMIALRVLFAGLLTMALGACSPSAVPSVTSGEIPVASTAATIGADPIVAFREQRDVICRDGSGDIAAINARMEGASAEDQVTAFGQIVDRLGQAQNALDGLVVPGAMAEFVAADNERRAERIRLVEELAAAVAADDEASVTAIDRELTDLNIATEAAEDAKRLIHCP